jgi:hypothetical protein
MAWSPLVRQPRSWLVEQAGDYATPISRHIHDGTQDRAIAGEMEDAGPMCRRDAVRPGDRH